LPAVAGEEAATHAEAFKGGVEVDEGGLREAGHRITVQGQQGQGRNAGEGRLGDRAEQVETQIQHLDDKNDSVWK